jgi:hypothetical protein
MFVFDVETLGKQSHSVILSMACVHFDPTAKPSHHDLKANAFFAKFKVKDQVQRLNRVVGKTTMEWWNKQCENVRRKSFTPSSNDVIFEDGYEAMREWVKQFNEPRSWVWARGNLDQLVMDDIEESIGLDPIFPYARWRDVRTAIDLLYTTDRGYIDVDYDGFDSFLDITKHDPVDDCVYDAMQLMYGVTRGETND